MVPVCSAPHTSTPAIHCQDRHIGNGQHHAHHADQCLIWGGGMAPSTRPPAVCLAGPNYPEKED